MDSVSDQLSPTPQALFLPPPLPPPPPLQPQNWSPLSVALLCHPLVSSPSGLALMVEAGRGQGGS